MYDARLSEHLPRVQERIGRALERVGRAARVTIVAVAKGHPASAVIAAADVGLCDVGENRVQELEAKRSEADGRVRWHMIGHLQRNKVKRVLPLFDMIHSVDSMRLAQELSKEAVHADRDVDALVQVNASGEGTKGGVNVSEGVDVIGAITELPRLRVRGLMTMAPLTDDETVIRSTFSRTRSLFEACASALPAFDGVHLSMGMSSDFEIAVEEGSTMVRLGTALFGERQQ